VNVHDGQTPIKGRLGGRIISAHDNRFSPQKRRKVRELLRTHAPKWGPSGKERDERNIEYSRAAVRGEKKHLERERK